MIGQAKEYIGKKMTMSEISKLFPECYVALDDYFTDGYNTTGILIYVCKSQDEITDVLEDYANKGKKLYKRYTTESKEFLGTTIFNKVDLSFFNRAKEKHMSIEFDRDVYGTVETTKDINNGESITTTDDKSVITYVMTFVQNA